MNRRLGFVLSLSLSLFLAACGGGGGGVSPSPPPSPVVVVPPPVPTLSVTLTPSTRSQIGNDTSSLVNFTLNAVYVGESTDPIVPVITLDDSLLSLDGPITLAGKTYTAKIKSKEALPVKQYKSTVQFRLCKEAACTNVYPGSTQSFEHTLDVKIGDWVTRQRNAAHNGYVNVSLDPAKFVKSWDWAPTTGSGFEPISARAGRVFVTQRNSDGTTTALALNGISGAEEWRYNLGPLYHSSGPAILGDELAFSTMRTSSTENPLTILNATTGQLSRNFMFAAQWSTFAQPTPSEDTIFMSAGYYGNVVYGFDLKGAVPIFSKNGSLGKTTHGQAPAVDSKYVYYYSGNLDVLDRKTGEIVKSIPDPFWTWNGYSYGGTPMIGSENNVIAFAGNGQGTYDVAFPLVNFDVQAGVHRWRTTDSYGGTPAVAKGVIYAYSNLTKKLAALEETTGKVLWTWTAPAIGGAFVGNIVASENLIFVSTESSVYAIDVGGTHETKWSAPTPGWLAITPDLKLIVVSAPAAGAKYRITAYSVQ